MYKIAHISDPHISYKDENEHGKRLVGVLNDIKKKGCDHVIVTGDIVENPYPEDFEYSKEIFSHFGLLENSKMSVVPGNHDIFGGYPKAQDSFRFYINCKRVDYDKNVDQFIEVFKNTFPNNNAFPYVKIINNIALIGINSMGEWSMKNNREGSNGFIEGESLEKLKKILSSAEVKNKYKIVMVHHYFYKPGLDEEKQPEHTIWLKAINWKMKLYNKKNLFRMFKKYKVNLILNGHSHVNQVYIDKGITVVNSSTCVMPLTDDQIRMYNIISIPEEGDTERSIIIETIPIEE
ncbi:MAG: metallophosphoesterase [bacterium]|nr:metallophosphoesterase [bacterium]